MPHRVTRKRLALAAASVVSLVMSSACETDPIVTPGNDVERAVVQTSAGEVRGTVEPGLRVFRGIPYAAAPVGPLRWQAPQAPTPWVGVRDATKPGARCIQDTRRDPDFGRAASEDCLNLNVWTPRGATPGNKRPVMVWIHGGGFLNGSADIYDAHWMTTQGDIVIVTVNYRLGALGFLALDALNGDGDVGNYGLADQQAALRWVRDNIANFGGDADKVTIAGESAGAMSVCDHLVAPGSAGLYRSAILQSGPCQVQADRATAVRVSDEYARGLGCVDPAKVAVCLRGLPPSRLQSAPLYVGFGDDRLTGPVTGTRRLPQNPLTAAARRDLAEVPVLIGTNGDEFTMFVAVQYLRDNTLPPYRQMLVKTFGHDAAAVAAHYPLDRYGGQAGPAYAAAVTDSVFACPTNRLVAGAAPDAPVYAYEFNDRTAPAPDPLRRAPFPVGASHSLELRYLFNVGGAPPLNPAQRKLADEMIAYWSEFVKTGSPNLPDQPPSALPEWPQVGADAATGPLLSLQTGALSVTTDFAARHQCAFWASIPGPR